MSEQQDRIGIVGWGSASPLGCTPGAVWSTYQDGKSRIAHLPSAQAWGAPLNQAENAALAELQSRSKNYRRLDRSVLLAMLALVVLSGAALALGGARGGTEAIHEALALGFHVALAAYLAGVVWASLHYRANLVLTLLTGVKPLPDDLYWHNGPDHDAATAHPRAGNPGATPERRVFRRRRHI